MSLLHNVLRDIDRRDNGGAAVLPIQLSGYSDTGRHFSALKKTLSVALPLITAGVLWFALKPLPATEENTAVAATDRQAAAPLIKVDVAVEDRVADQPLELNSVPAALPLKEPLPAPSLAIEETEIAERFVATVSDKSTVEKNEPEKPVAEGTVAEDIAPAEKRAEKLMPVSEQKKLPQPVKISRRQNSAHQLYVKAVSALSDNNDPLQALILINQAISQIQPDLKEDYLTLKLRILLEQKSSDEFLKWYQKYSQINSAGWLAVAAPGLHMLGFEQQAVVPYQKLIVLQPQVVNWPLALASAWETLEQKSSAIAVLENTRLHYSLTSAQSQWISTKLARLR